MRIYGCVLSGLAAFLCLVTMPSLWGGVIENICFSDKSYASSIETEGWVVTEAQLREVFAEQKDPTQLTYRELDEVLIYFLIRLKNLQCYRAWGTLRVFSFVHDATLDVLNVEPRLDNNIHYVVPIGKYSFQKSKYDQKPSVSFRWKHLYVK